MHIGATCTQPHCPRDTPCRESRYRRDAHQNIGQPLGNGCRSEERVIGRILTPVGQGTVGRVSQADIRRSSEQRTGVLFSVRAGFDSGLPLEARLPPPPPAEIFRTFQAETASSPNARAYLDVRVAAGCRSEVPKQLRSGRTRRDARNPVTANYVLSRTISSNSRSHTSSALLTLFSRSIRSGQMPPRSPERDPHGCQARMKLAREIVVAKAGNRNGLRNVDGSP